MNAQDKDAYYTYMKEVLTQRDVISAAEAKGEVKGTIKVAVQMIKEKMKIELIAKLTGLSVAEINELILENSEI
jgi:predicted transposase/invertase (TIGR01784 family)